MNSEMLTQFGYITKTRLRSSSGNREAPDHRSSKASLPPKSRPDRNFKGQT